MVTVNKLLKAGMRGHGECGGLSRSRRLSASSPLRAKTERAPMRDAYAIARTLID